MHRLAAATALSALLALAVACGAPAPTPTATPLPPAATATPTPAPTATPTSLPPAPAAAMDFDKETLLGEIFAAVLTEEEAGCIEEDIGSAAFQELLAASPEDTVSGFAYFPGDCLSPEHLDNLQIALFAAAAGGLSAQTLECMRGVYAESTPEDFLYRYFGMTLCFSDEEAVGFYGEDTGDDNWVFPPPAVLRWRRGRGRPCGQSPTHSAPEAVPGLPWMSCRGAPTPIALNATLREHRETRPLTLHLYAHSIVQYARGQSL